MTRLTGRTREGGPGVLYFTSALPLSSLYKYRRVPCVVGAHTWGPATCSPVEVELTWNPLVFGASSRGCVHVSTTL